jgi:hypothetical protein
MRAKGPPGSQCLVAGAEGIRTAGPLLWFLALMNSKCRRAHDMAAPVLRGASSAGKVTLPNQPRAEIFDFAKAQGRQFDVERICLKLAPERLSERGDARDKRLSGEIVLILIGGPIDWGRKRISVVDHNVGGSGQAGDESERRKDRLLR